jgi:formylglycine-generating enzyme required for sulfatase activity
LKYRYPYDPNDGRESLQADRNMYRVLRGGAFYNDQWYVRCAFRNRGNPDLRYDDRGFRVVVSPFFGL